MAIENQKTSSQRGAILLATAPIMALFLVLGGVSGILTSNSSNCSTITLQATEVTPSTTPVKPLVAIEPTRLSLSGSWRFTVDRDGQGQAKSWQSPGFDDSRWQSVDVPDTWNVMADYSDYEGCAWYRKTFSVPPDSAQSASVRLRFDAVFYRALIWLNGTFVGQHDGGYTPFEFDISDLVQNDNVLVVEVDNERAYDRIPAILYPGWSYDWWNYGGIVRDVNVDISSRAFIVGQRIVAIPHLVGQDTADSASVTTTITVSNTSGEVFDGKLHAQVVDAQTGQAVVDSILSPALLLQPGETADLALTFALASPKLWHFDHPNLYRWTTDLISSQGQTIDQSDDTFGIRSVEFRGSQLLLNGEPVRLVGLTRHEDSPQAGLAETVDIMAADYQDLKTLNDVFSRPVHYPQADYILDYADQHGILFIPELPAWQLTVDQMADPEMRDLARQQLREMVQSEANHPSIWAWSVGNEIASKSPAGHQYVSDMIAYVKSLDPTRPVGFASNQLYSSPSQDATALSDFVMMNQYFGTWGGSKNGLSAALDQVNRTWPNKPVIISEFGFEPRWNALWGPPTNELNADQYYFIPDNVSADSDLADAQRRQVIADQMAAFRNRPFIVGAIFWTYQDYRTPAGFVMGIVDAQRNHRGSWETLRQAFSPVLFDGLSLNSASDGLRTATVSLRTRGPLAEAIPAYTLRGYTLHWEVMSGDTTLAEGDIALPTLTPGTAWTGQIQWNAQVMDCNVHLSVRRPTGFEALDTTYPASCG
jgi:beta-glucuronidase